MSDLQILLERNQHFATQYKGGLQGMPKLTTFVLTCSDARIDPAHFLGLELGDALVFRNAGRRITDDIELELGILWTMAAGMMGKNFQSHSLKKIPQENTISCDPLDTGKGTLMTMKFFVRSLGIILVLAMVMATFAASDDLKEIMQGLREDTNAIADGLLTDDFEKVVIGANSIASHAQIPPEQVQLVAAELGSEMPAFKQMDILVHDLSLEIAAAAKEEDRERAIADFHRMLDGCFNCHAAYKTRVAVVLSDSANAN